MGSSLFAKKRQNMNLYHFGLFLLFVLAANGAPDPNPSPKAAPKPNPNPRAKAQMAIIFNGGKSVYDYNGRGGRGGRGGGDVHDYSDYHQISGPKAEQLGDDWWRITKRRLPKKPRRRFGWR